MADSFVNHPLLQVKPILKVIDETVIDPLEYVAGQFFPSREINEDRITWDERKLRGGMTKPVVRGSESPIVEMGGARQRTFEPAEFREKVIFGPNELNHLRRLGTTSELETAQEMVARTVSDLRLRVENRMEWARWQAMLGTLTVNENGINYTINYNVPSAMTSTLTGADLWSAFTTADPIDDIMTWVQNYRTKGAKPRRFWMNSVIHQHLMRNERVLSMIERTFAGQSLPAMSPNVLQSVFNTFIGGSSASVPGGIPLMVWDKGVFFVTQLTSASTTNTTLVVQDPQQIAANDVLTLLDNDVGGETEEATVSSISGRTVTTSANLSNAYVIGTEVRYFKPFIPNTRFIIEGALPPGTIGGQNWGEFIITRSEYSPGTLMNPVPGIFAQVNVWEQADPKRVEVISGVNGLPVMYYSDINFLATVA